MQPGAVRVMQMGSPGGLQGQAPAGSMVLAAQQQQAQQRLLGLVRPGAALGHLPCLSTVILAGSWQIAGPLDGMQR